jgi:hypothetical protein
MITRALYRMWLSLGEELKDLGPILWDDSTRACEADFHARFLTLFPRAKETAWNIMWIVLRNAYYNIFRVISQVRRFTSITKEKIDDAAAVTRMNGELKTYMNTRVMRLLTPQTTKLEQIAKEVMDTFVDQHLEKAITALLEEDLSQYPGMGTLLRGLGDRIKPTIRNVVTKFRIDMGPTAEGLVTVMIDQLDANDIITKLTEIIIYRDAFLTVFGPSVYDRILAEIMRLFVLVLHAYIICLMLPHSPP